MSSEESDEEQCKLVSHTPSWHSTHELLYSLISITLNTSYFVLFSHTELQRIGTRMARQPRQGFQLKPRECGLQSLKPPPKPVKKWALTPRARSQSLETPQAAALQSVEDEGESNELAGIDFNE